MLSQIIRRGTLFTLLLLAALGGGCGPSWKVVQPGSSAYSRQTEFVVTPIVYQDLRIGKKPETEWLSKKKPEQVRSWEADKMGIDANFGSQLSQNAYAKQIQVQTAGKSKEGQIEIQAVVTRIEPGYYAGIAAAGAEIDAKIQFRSGGKLLEEITVTAGSPSRFSIGERVRVAATNLGRIAAEYLATRVSL